MGEAESMSNQHSIVRQFGQRAFLKQEAFGRGITRGSLENPHLARPFNGIRAASPVGNTLRERALAFLPRMRPDDRFSHKTALALLGCPIYVDESSLIDVESPTGTTPFRRNGLSGHRTLPGVPTLQLLIPEHEFFGGEDRGPIPTAAPLRAALQASTQLPFREIVVALDFLLRHDAKHFDPVVRVTPEELLKAAQKASGQRGARKFRAATQFARVGAESRMESLTRLIGEAVGLQDLKLQHEIRDRNGRFIGRFDLADEDSMSLFEYDGEQHRLSTRQYRHDLRRLDNVRAEGWRPLRLHAEDILQTPLETGQRMLAHAGRKAAQVSGPFSELLTEQAPGPVVSAQPKTYVS
jgi:very-short-patch-repair endonuclease